MNANTAEAALEPIRTIAIIGAGGLGAAYASLLYAVDPGAPAFVAGGRRYDRLLEEGVIVNNRLYRIPLLRPDDARTPPADLVLVAVKYQQLNQALEDMRNRIGDGTIILSVMNGIDSEERIGARYGADRVLYAVALGIDALREGNRVTFSTQGRIYFGEARNATLSGKVEKVRDLFTRAGIIYEIPEDMVRTLWWKFMINVGINQASAVLRAPYSVFQTDRAARDLMETAMREVILIAGAAGINLSEQDIADWYDVLPKLSPEGKTSMLQDIEAGRKTEVEMLAGKVMELGRHYGIPTPVNASLFKQIREAELSAP